jgi:ribosomal protein L11 methylase PrmA
MDIQASLDGAYDPGSFRDPSSRVLHRGTDVFRTLSEQGLADWRALSASPRFAEWVSSGRLVATEEVSENGVTMLQHSRIPFWSYPYEWSFSMLQAAALLQLDLLEEALESGLTLKDATPYNVQFRGTKPVFVDVGSFAPYEPGEPWLGYRQFCRQFLYPLMLRAHGDVAFQPMLRGSLDGIPATTARQFLRGRRTLKPGVLADVALQARAERSMSGSDRNVRSELSSAGFNAQIILGNVRRLKKVIARTTWTPGTSTWSDYADCGHVATQRTPKEAFVRKVAAARHRSLVWDLGANDAHFSIAIAGGADTVVAIDGDEETIEAVYRRLAQGGPQNVLPLVMNLADPSPGLGWRGAERAALDGRDKPDLVLMLAVVHHMVIGSNLPLAAVIDWLESLGSDAVFEWVPLDDPMSQRLTANKKRSEVHSDYSEEHLRSYLEGRFHIVEEMPLEGRRLFHLTPHR